MNDEAFFSAGLRFSCTRCSNCCRKESGYVYLSENDLSRLADFFAMDYTSFIQTWCRWVSFERGRERLSLKEKANYDCIFWGTECTVYHARPLQCRSFPFWDSVLCSRESWENTGKDCPGIQTGELHEKEKIEKYLQQMDDELVIERKLGGI